ncbi:CHAT domain-containing protein [Streptomyces chiangmaiensis]|uniref:CHAT domain-containing protein n=1 Tax=Streptomyces chiangmaiensis TaxID=766497 RepID=A0ABU7FUF9_9ACTN|nr:CHAT domain-containing protein [Streptomyces chiangmaiensis]MED7827730.1 CHAT domain-containing protein [Streptomyces chiangmaiensis]
MASYSIPYAFACPHCGAHNSTTSWVTVDIDERPDMAQRIRRGDIPGHTVCTGCESTLDLGHPLLVGRPGRRPELLLVPGRNMPPDNQREYVEAAMSLLARGWTGRTPLSHLDDNILPITADVLSYACDRDIEEDLHTWAAGELTAYEPEQARYHFWLDETARARWQVRVKAPTERLLAARTFDDIVRLVREAPELLDPKVDELLGEMLSTMMREYSPDEVVTVTHRRHVLRRCRRLGPEQALSGTISGPEVLVGALRLMPTVGEAVVHFGVGTPPRRERELSAEEECELLEAALFQMTPQEAELGAASRWGETLTLREELRLHLAERLCTSSSASDLWYAVWLYGLMDHRRAGTPAIWAFTRYRIGMTAARLHELAEPDCAARALAAFDDALAAVTPQAQPTFWAATARALADFTATCFEDLPAPDPHRISGLLATAVEIRGRDVDLVLALCHIGVVHTDGHRPQAEIDLVVRTLTNLLGGATAAGRLGPAARCHTLLGMALTKRAQTFGTYSDYRRAMEELTTAVELYRQTKNFDEFVTATLALAHIAVEDQVRDETVTALVHEARDHARKAGMRRRWAKLTNYLARLLLLDGDGDQYTDAEEALSLISLAERTFTREDSPAGWAALQIDRSAAAERGWLRKDPQYRAVVEESFARYAAAADVLDCRRHRAEWARLLTARASSHLVLARMSEEQGGSFAARKAERVLKEAASLLTDPGDRRAWARIQCLLAEALFLVGEREAGHSALSRASTVWSPEGPDPSAHGMVTLLKAEAHAAEGDHETALTEYAAASALFRSLGTNRQRRRAAAGLGRLLVRLGRFEEAVPELTAAIEALYREAAAITLPHVRERVLGEYGWIAAVAAEALVALDRLSEAVEVLESLRARLLRDAVDRHPQRYAHLSRERPDTYEAFSKAARWLTQLEGLAAQLTAKPAEFQDDGYHAVAERNLRDALREAGQKYAKARAALLGAEEPAVRSGLAARVSSTRHPLVYLFATASGCTALIVAGDRIESVKAAAPTDTELHALLYGDDSLGGIVALRPGTTAARRELRACLDRLAGISRSVSAVLQDFGATELTIVACGLLTALPLHAAAADGHCLLDEFTVSHAPSAATLLAARQTARSRRAEPKAMYVVDRHDGPPFAPVEVISIANTLPGEVIASEGRISSGHLLGSLRDRTHLHFACHGESTLDYPMYSHIRLSAETELTLIELALSTSLDGEQTPLRDTRLVVCSSCQSAVLAGTHAPEEVIGLPAGFLAVGVPAYIGTLWPVPDVAAYLVMSRFYARLLPQEPELRPLPAAAALRQAQLWLRDLTGRDLLDFLHGRALPVDSGTQLVEFARRYQDRKLYEDPANWAGYVLVGAHEAEIWTPS